MGDHNVSPICRVLGPPWRCNPRDMGSSGPGMDALGDSSGPDTPLSPEQATLQCRMPDPFLQHWKVLPLLPGVLPERGLQALEGRDVLSTSPAQPTLTEPGQASLLFLKKVSATQTWQREFLRANSFYCISTSCLGEVGRFLSF